MSDIDDLPDLVESSDDEKVKPPKKGVDHAMIWLRKPESFLKQQFHWMRVFCLSPFLFGIDDILPIAWSRALFKARLLLTETRETSIDYLTWEELECVDLMEAVMTLLQKSLRDKEQLGSILDFIEKMTAVLTDVDMVLREAEKSEYIKNIWKDALKTEEAIKKERESKFAVLYGLRLYAQHVLYLSKNSKNFVDEVRKKRKKKVESASPTAEELKAKGNESFKNNNYEEAIQFYTQACKKDPHNHIYYGNRAQAYLRLDNKMMYALADGRRAVTIKSEFAKGHYRYAFAFYKLGRLDSAIKVNEKGILQCRDKNQDPSNLNQLTNQRDDYVKEREKRDPKKTLTPLPDSLGKKLDFMNSSKPSPDLNEKFNCAVPGEDSHDDKKESTVPDRLVNSNKTPVVPVVSLEEETMKKKEDEKQDLMKHLRENVHEEEMTSYLKTLEMRMKAEEISVSLEKEAMKKKEEEKQDLMKHLREGSDFLAKNVYKEAMTSYLKALDMFAKANGPEYFGMDEFDLVTLKYAFGTAAVGTGQSKNILEGVEKFTDIIENHVDIRFPLAYYGLGKAYVDLNRYSDALKPIMNGLQAASKVRYSDVAWPGTTQLIPDNEPEVLVRLLKDLKQLCKCPPMPDAVCRYHSEEVSGLDRNIIYVSDPNFKGYTKIICHMRCVIFFHSACWKDFRISSGKHADKEMFETSCPTPDCQGLIVKLEVMRHDGVVKEYLCEKYQSMKEATKAKKSTAQSQKQKTTSEAKLALKQEKKEQRKQRRRERQEETGDLREEVKNIRDEPPADKNSNAIMVEDILSQVNPPTLPVMRETTILKKDDFIVPQTISGKSKRSKKKKDKSKHVLTVEVNFTDKKEGLLSEKSVLSDNEEEKLTLSPANPAPFSVPNVLKKEIKQFEKTYTGPQKPMFKPDTITDNLFSFFSEILKANGPLEITDDKIQQELEVFPVEALEKIKNAGGLGDFLRQSLKFAVIANIVSLMSDAVKARELAMSKRTAGQAPNPKNAWQTVGKGAQVVDSLSESIDVPIHKYSAVKPILFSSVTGITVPLVSSSSNASSFSKSSTPEPLCPIASPVAVSKGAASTTFSPNNSSFSGGGSKMNILDSIDDYPLETLSRTSGGKMDDLDDFETVSETGSNYSGSASKHFGATKSANTMSRSSSKSDMSDNSRSDFSSGVMPKPLRPVGNGDNFPKSTQLWDRLENDFDSSFSKVSNEGSDSERSEQFVNMDRELQQATEDFVRNSDETLVSEIAESVVDKMIKDNGMSSDKREELLEKVSKDIWKDFEKSKNSNKSKSGGMWANTPASDDGSKKASVYADDFMKRHYRSSDYSNFSPLKLSSPYIDSGGLSLNFTSTTSPWSSAPGNLFPSTSENTKTHTVGSDTSSNSSFSMFNGLSWGGEATHKMTSLNNFSQPPPTSLPLSLPQLSQPVIRPPLSASTFYNPPSIVPPRFTLPVQRAPMPPHMTMTATGMMQCMVAETKDKETQTAVKCFKDAECMTDPYELFKQEFQQMGEERDRLTQLLNKSVFQYEKLSQDLMERENLRKKLELQIYQNTSWFENQKKEWNCMRDNYEQEKQQLQKTINMKDSQEQQLNGKIEQLQSQLHDQTCLLYEQRERDVEDKRRQIEHHKTLCQVQTQRAQAAEVDLLKSKLKNEKARLGSVLKEANMRNQHLNMVFKKYSDEKQPVSSQLQQQFDYLQSLIDNLEATIARITREYEGQIQDIQNGTPYSELPPITVPSPPPVLDTLNATSNQPGLMPRGPQFNGNRPVNRLGLTAGSQQDPAISNSTNGFTPTSPQNIPVNMATVPSNPIPNQAPPQPLTLPSVGRGIMPPLRPMAGVRPVVSLNRPPLRPLIGHGLAQPMSSFDKLVLKLEKMYPGKTRNELSVLIKELRTRQGGSLSGMTLDDIIRQIGELIAQAENKESRQYQTGPSRRPLNPPPGLSNWAFLASDSKNGQQAGSTQNIELFQEEEDPCAICHEEMVEKPSVTLECCHTFHDECIRKWFQEQSTCPNCRVHTLLPDDFPSLG